MLKICEKADTRLRLLHRAKHVLKSKPYKCHNPITNWARVTDCKDCTDCSNTWFAFYVRSAAIHPLPPDSLHRRLWKSTMPSPRCYFVLLSIALYLSIQQRESFAFSWTKNFIRKKWKNPSRFQVGSITSTNLNKMRQRPVLDNIRLEASSSSSLGVDDGGAENLRSSTNWWRKDPRNRSVSGILICRFDRWTDNNEIDVFHHMRATFATHTHWNSFFSFFSLSFRVHDGGRTVGKSNSALVWKL